MQIFINNLHIQNGPKVKLILHVCNLVKCALTEAGNNTKAALCTLVGVNLFASFVDSYCNASIQDRVIKQKGLFKLALEDWCGLIHDPLEECRPRVPVLPPMLLMCL